MPALPPLDPRDFVQPDGTYAVTPINEADRDQVAEIRRYLNLPSNDEE